MGLKEYHFVYWISSVHSFRIFLVLVYTFLVVFIIYFGIFFSPIIAIKSSNWILLNALYKSTKAMKVCLEYLIHFSYECFVVLWMEYMCSLRHIWLNKERFNNRKIIHSKKKFRLTKNEGTPNITLFIYICLNANIACIVHLQVFILNPNYF